MLDLEDLANSVVSHLSLRQLTDGESDTCLSHLLVDIAVGPLSVRRSMQCSTTLVARLAM